MIACSKKCNKQFKWVVPEMEIKQRRDCLENGQETFIDKLESRLRVTQDELIVLLNLKLATNENERPNSLAQSLSPIAKTISKHLVNAFYAYAIFKQPSPTFDLEEFNRIEPLAQTNSSDAISIWSNELLENSLLNQINFLAVFINSEKRFADQWKLFNLIVKAFGVVLARELSAETIREIVDFCNLLLYLTIC